MGFWDQEGHADHDDDENKTNSQWGIAKTKEFKRKKAQGDIHNENNQIGKQITSTQDGFFDKFTF